MFYVYYKIPTTRGNVDTFANKASALHYARGIAQNYPGAHVEAYLIDAGGRVTLFQHDGVRAAA